MPHPTPTPDPDRPAGLDPEPGRRELSALRRLADDVWAALAHALPAERGPVWDRINAAYGRYTDYREGRAPEPADPVSEASRTVLDPDETMATLSCHLPAGTTTPQAPKWGAWQVAEFQAGPEVTR